MNNIMMVYMSLTITSSIIFLLLFVAKPLINKYLSRTWTYYIFIIIAFRFVIPIIPKTGFVVGAVTPLLSKNTTIITSTDPTSYFINQIPLNPSQTTLLYTELWRTVWLFWISISIGLFIYRVWGYCRFKRALTKNCFPVKRGSIYNRCLQYAEEMKLSRAPNIYIHARLHAPIMTGIFRPVIILPENVREEDLSCILLHELCHYKRKDIAVKWLQQLLACLYWFNPFAHIFNKEIDRYCELSCDEWVMKAKDIDFRRQYGNALLNVAKNKKHIAFLPYVSLGRDGKLLKERLAHIVKYENLSGKKRALSFIFGVVTIGAAFVMGQTLFGDKTAGRQELVEESGVFLDSETERIESKHMMLENNDTAVDGYLPVSILSYTGATDDYIIELYQSDYLNEVFSVGNKADSAGIYNTSRAYTHYKDDTKTDTISFLLYYDINYTEVADTQLSVLDSDGEVVYDIPILDGPQLVPLVLGEDTYTFKYYALGISKMDFTITGYCIK